MVFKTFKIRIAGQVQGVGFRPHVYNLATEFGLKGSVSNNEEGVVIFAQGARDAISAFYKTLIDSPPEVSKIDGHDLTEVENMHFEDFQIMPSQATSRLNLCLTPDFAICGKCQEDMSNRHNRRYNYPFTTCVNCGPRWAITKTFPFERHHTSLGDYKMCEFCEEEYTNPKDRRFHSQTNTCATCGIHLELIDKAGHCLTRKVQSIFPKLKDLLSNGAIIAIKNTSGYLLCCDATNAAVVQKLRQKKHRPHKPFALMYPSLALLKSHCAINEYEKAALTSAVRPIVIVQKLTANHDDISTTVAPGLHQLGVMLPNSGILQLVANEIDFPIVATSGNISGSPILSDNHDAFEKLNSVADYFLQHNLEITHPQDDSVIKFSRKFNIPIVLRRSRGYAPNYLDFKISNAPKVMAMGAHLKSTVAFLPNDYLYVSQYLGHLENFDVYKRFVQTASDFTAIFKEKPRIVLADLHPAYQSTLYGMEWAAKHLAQVKRIQHHKAHFASVLAEHQLFITKEPVLGVIWDGTGYGDDGQIWGGEFFKYKASQMQRVNHFEYFDWIAGDKMAKDPRLSLLSLLEDNSKQILSQKFADHELRIYERMKMRNSLKTSSVGRLFDAVASLLNVCNTNTYEGEAAIKLENLITDYDLAYCKVYVTLGNDGSISSKKLIQNISEECANGIETPIIARNFFFTLAALIIQTAQYHNVTKIACSGGVFQNAVLIDMLTELAGDAFELFFNRNLSSNDENSSVGQMMYYLNGIDER